ncbi:DUF1439 domain-containing protein [Aliiglaciecola sp. LCG003]|uniref:DUF1439 domain-containing protein n=1 Tax=Aliiglaciecola sp. LCG003 TaxID=3053655 RepID=UPI00257367CF|nr:DUF1439 domain-containing protein [Aliiglaciecola sp. LCG003]WJG08190.1 DUF1439 domain-containing protein [Aliiglaciecola sp. LCG003]
MKTSWRQDLVLWLQQLSARWMIKRGKLPHVDYSIEELNELAEPHFPQSFLVDVPVGKGTFTLLNAHIDIPSRSDSVHVKILASLDIDSAGTPLYRAHLSISLLVTPQYDVTSKTVSIEQMLLDSIELINDEYALLNNSRQLLDLVLPKGVQNLISGTFKSAIGLMTAGSSDMASDYLHLYLSGSKQKILNYHQPQIIKLIEELKQDPEFVYEMDEDDWQQKLFREYGKTVVVEDRCVRFKF